MLNENQIKIDLNEEPLENSDENLNEKNNIDDLDSLKMKNMISTVNGNNGASTTTGNGNGKSSNNLLKE